MKKIIKKISFLSLFVALLVFNSCQEEFTVRPSEDTISLDSYYKDNEQVRSATNGLYSRTWFQFNNKFFYAITEVGSGNMFSGSSDVSSMVNFSLNGSDPELYNGWNSLFSNVIQAGSIINYLPERVGPAVTQDVLNNTLGEAHFMRATAYFYLVRLWGAVPIIEDNTLYINDPQLNTNRIEDVYQFIINDYQKAIELLDSKVRGSNYGANARVSSGSAKALLAKVYLTLKDYPNAASLSLDVINSNEFKLLGGSELPSKSFGDLFTYPNNNNEESIFSLQWKIDGRYGSANNCNTQFGIGPDTSNATYGGVFGPSQDILTLYSASDIRRNETLMLPGNVYPNMRVTSGLGLTVPDADNAQASGAGIKKYCIGKTTDLTGPADKWAMMENATYIMRYADLLLIHAEAVLGNGGSTSSTTAINAFNAVRNRAGLTSMSSITFDDIFTERRKELAFEGDYWFDLGRIPRSQAIAIMAAQNRGNKYTAQYFTPTEADFYLPYPDNEVSLNPKLLDPPVPYQF